MPDSWACFHRHYLPRGDGWDFAALSHAGIICSSLHETLCMRHPYQATTLQVVYGQSCLAVADTCTCKCTQTHAEQEQALLCRLPVVESHVARSSSLSYQDCHLSYSTVNFEVAGTGLPCVHRIWSIYTTDLLLQAQDSLFMMRCKIGPTAPEP